MCVQISSVLFCTQLLLNLSTPHPTVREKNNKKYTIILVIEADGIFMAFTNVLSCGPKDHQLFVKMLF